MNPNWYRNLLFQTPRKSTNTFIAFLATALFHLMSGKDLNSLLPTATKHLFSITISTLSLLQVIFLYHSSVKFQSHHPVWTMFHLMCQRCFHAALGSLDVAKSMGTDGISPRVLKHCAPALCAPLHHLFSLSLSTHTLPNEWRIHLIIPIYKSGDKSEVSNYRPISLLCTVSKVLENLVYNKIIDFITNSISPTQFGFLPMHSTLQQLLIMFDSIYTSLENKLQTDMI